MPNAEITKTCIVYKDAKIVLNDKQGRPAVRVTFKAGGEYDLPEWWYTPLRERGAITPPGKQPPPPWDQLALGKPVTEETATEE